MDIQNLTEQKKIQLFVNRRYAFFQLFVYLIGCIIIYLAFSHLKKMSSTEEFILLVFLASCMLRPLFRLFNPFATIELTSKGLSYHGDFKSYAAITRIELKKRRWGLLIGDHLKIFTNVKEHEEVIFNISFLDCSLSLAEVKKLILERKAHFSNATKAEDHTAISVIKKAPSFKDLSL